MSENAKTARWFAQRLPAWRLVAGRLAGLERGASARPTDLLAAVRSYPEIASDLAVAKRSSPQGQLTRYLERVYLDLHSAIFRRPGDFKHEILTVFLRDAPAVAKALRMHIAWIATLFVASAAAGAWLIATFPSS